MNRPSLPGHPTQFTRWTDLVILDAAKSHFAGRYKMFR